MSMPQPIILGNKLLVPPTVCKRGCEVEITLHETGLGSNTKLGEDRTRVST